jgi:hypothetical protein
MDNVVLRINIVRRNENNMPVTMHTYFCTEAPAVNDQVELGHAQFLVVRRFWHPLQLETTVTVLVEEIA